VMEELINRLRQQHQRDDAEEQAAGRMAGSAWACKQATSLQLQALECLRHKPVSDAKFMHVVVSSRSTKCNEEKASCFAEVWGGHLSLSRPYTSTYLRAFVAGALEIWDEVKEEILSG